MSFMRRPRSGERAMPGLEAVRDVVEIVAIVAAGAWAFYTFVYQNDIKPSTSPPILQYDAKLSKLGRRGNLVAVETHVELKDAGVTDVYAYGFAETVVGTRVVRSPLSALRVAPNAGETELKLDWHDSQPVPVYAFATLTKLAQPASKNEINFEPGQSFAFDRIFFVPAAAYDQLQLHLDITYAAHPNPMTVRLVTRHGVVHLADDGTSDAAGNSGVVATLAMW